MKKIMYIQPTIEVVKLQSLSICNDPSPVPVGGDLPGSDDPDSPLDF